MSINNNDLHLNLRFEIADGSKLRFLKRNKSFFIICVDNEVKICNLDSEKHHDLKNNYYKFEIKDYYFNKEFSNLLNCFNKNYNEW